MKHAGAARHPRRHVRACLIAGPTHASPFRPTVLTCALPPTHPAEGIAFGQRTAGKGVGFRVGVLVGHASGPRPTFHAPLLVNSIIDAGQDRPRIVHERTNTRGRAASLAFVALSGRSV